MKTVLSVALPLVVLALFLASMGYVAYRLRVLFGLEGRWPLRIGVAVVVIGAAIGMLATAKLSSPLVGALNVLGGYVFIFYFFLLLALLGLHAVQLKWSLPLMGSGVACVVVALAVTVSGALWADSFTVTETEIRLRGLERELTNIQNQYNTAVQNAGQATVGERLEVMDALPSTPSGKIQKFKLREMLRGA